MFCLDALCKRGFALSDRMTDCLGFIADPDAVKTGALMDIRMAWVCFWPVAGIGRFERESAECWSVERRLKFIVVSADRDGDGQETRRFDPAIDFPITMRQSPVTSKPRPVQLGNTKGLALLP